jgi:hypothetical protein
MKPTEINAGAKAAIGTLRESMAVGKEGAKIVTDIQAEMHAVVNQERQKRARALKEKEQLGSQQEQTAYRKFLERARAAQDTADLKDHIIKTHGPKSWEEFLKVKAEVEKYDIAETQLVKNDKDKINDLFWWCMAAAFVIVYFISGG